MQVLWRGGEQSVKAGGKLTQTHHLEQEAIAALVAVLPAGVRPVILADRGFARADLLVWLQSPAPGLCASATHPDRPTPPHPTGPPE